MRILKRLHCFLTGHKTIKCEETEFEKVFPALIWHGMPPSPTFPQSHSLAYKIVAIPYLATTFICERCKKYCWKADHKSGIICDIGYLPGMEKMVEVYERVRWEEEHRKTNLTADKLYKQYLMVLKLSL